MKLLNIKFWVNLTLVVATAYIIIWYILTPSNNQCQMTFMMEPPRFIPVPVDDINTSTDSNLNYPEIDIRGFQQKSTSYKLFMYSEFGFPQASNVRHDLKDSMPVLFVPGNAGSYQQVRSLASTCIRHQLQSLDAFKFIFYTIDFRGQLSGISGQLIEDQTLFVQKSLNQIAKMHPTETNGIIMIGHSVGGFISKALFTMPSFNPNSVPLLISLASPLTSPYLTFDDKMRELYQRTNDYWEDNRSKRNSSIAISISGGKPDRLVPMHLSLDPQYDISLTTSSMKDVWLTTDHVCITWCKELMYKLSNLLSALMDKRQTRLISNKNLAMSIIRKELLVNVGNSEQESKDVIIKDWKSIRPHKVIDFDEFYSDSRLRLGDSMIFLKNNHSREDILIIIDFIGTLKDTGIFGCQAVNFSSSPSNQANCLGKLDLMQFAHVVPSRRFEPNRLAFKLIYSENYPINYIVFDFLSLTSGYGSNNIEHKVPEFLTVQRLNSTTLEESIYIPSVIQYLFKRLFFIDNFHYELSSHHKAFPLIYLRYRIINLKQKTQMYSIKYESHSCLNGETPRGATIVFYQAGYVTESFHPITNNKGILSIDLKISPQPAVRINEQSQTMMKNQSYLDFYIDGTCKNSLDIELDILALVVDSIQKSLGKLMTCATLFAYQSLISATFKLVSHQQVAAQKTNSAPGESTSLLGISIFIIMYAAASNHYQLLTKNHSSDDYIDQIVSIVLIYILSHGALAFLNCFINRVIDLAIIINNAQSMIRQKIGYEEQFEINASESTNGSRSKMNNSNLRKSFMRTDFDWLLIIVAISGSFMLSPALMALFILFIVVKLKLSLEIVRSKENHDYIKTTTTTKGNKHCSKQTTEESVADSKIVHMNNLMSNMAVFTVLALLSTIPAALIRINGDNNLTSAEHIFNLFYSDMSFLATIISLVSVKVICEVIATISIHDDLSTIEGRIDYSEPKRLFTRTLYSSLRLFSAGKHLHLLSLAPIIMIESNICYLTIASAISMAWSSGYLLIKFGSTSETRKHQDKD